MKRVFVFAILTIALFNLNAKNENMFGVSDLNGGEKNLSSFDTVVSGNTDTVIFIQVEEPAEFIGGTSALQEFIKNNLHYPQQAKEAKVEGLVFVSFVVEKDGSLSNVSIIKDIGYDCGQEVVRMIKSMPKWNPAKENGNVVRQQFNLPISFTLPQDE